MRFHEENVKPNQLIVRSPADDFAIEIDNGTSPSPLFQDQARPLNAFNDLRRLRAADVQRVVVGFVCWICW
jgi:hypothetical protein